MSTRRTMLLVGASGFAGTQLRREAEAAGIDVIATGREPLGEAPPCDLRDPLAVEECVAAVRPDLVVNAAGAASVRESWSRPGEAFAVNATGVRNLLEAVGRRATDAHVLCISSAEVYGEPGEEALPLAERLPLRPVTPYGEAKVAMEGFCGAYARAGGRVAVVRAFNLTGPGQSSRYVASGFARAIAAAEQDGATEVELAVGNLSATRDFTDVRDGARALLEVSRRGLGGTYNLCSGRPVTIAGLVERLAATTPLTVSTRQDTGLERPVDPPVLVGDPRLLREATGLEPEIPLARTLADLLDWWRQDPRPDAVS